MEPILGVLANRLKSRLQLNHAPVHKTYSAKVIKNIKTITTFKTHSLTRIVRKTGFKGSGLRVHGKGF